ncbi:MAG: enoyl-CoA hydratase [Alphaproteobacteria bacterium 64-11]|nr:enoyl-CoA hydratase/isomerase family protein [Alphaproteobacteria bacterium]OJU12220.1 MAG: enoyl-CoA hydratase [Alphaproteobacteria bacterium 64-11]
MAMSTVLTKIDGPVGIATLNRPEALNALNNELLDALADALEGWDSDPDVRVMIVTGSQKAFAAGADIKEMAPKSFSQMHAENPFGRQMDRVLRIKKPIIAAVAGFALGGGCELAMALDILIAADTAKFGQPEITLGVMPGLGGSQRTPLAMGKAKAMDLCLTGRMMDAAEAEAAGVAARVVPAEMLMDEALKAARKIAAQSLPAVMMIKEAINRAYEMPLSQGLAFERRAFHALFSTHDQKEGMAAFAEKRKAAFRNE